MAELILITVVVLLAFQDKFDHKTQYAPGDELQVEKERADDLIARGLAKLKKAPKPKGQPGAKNTGGKSVQPPKEKSGQVKAEDAGKAEGESESGGEETEAEGKTETESGAEEESEVNEEGDVDVTGTQEQ